ncbi:Lon-insertion domain-containing protein [Thiocapsa sp.]|uniref:Lon-insertion domain-containing protein n=1 Tax=Thiocapsa sp. TaxID=2024551 RepID=UPI002610055E|nr:Lon-insertion domain-containing protein [Thiocapsa sp.]
MSVAPLQPLRPRAVRNRQIRLDRGAVARVIERSARLADDNERLTSHMRSIGDLARESDYWAGADGCGRSRGDGPEPRHRSAHPRRDQSAHRARLALDQSGDLGLSSGDRALNSP